MAPPDVRKLPASQRYRITCGDGVGNNIWDEHVQPTQYALINPTTQLVCECCFVKVEDISQHCSRSSACTLFMANKHLCFCYQNNALSAWKPAPAIVSSMCLDPACPMSAKDILRQPGNWNPDENFVMGTGGNGHTTTTLLQNMSFRTLYNNYVAAHPGMIQDYQFVAEGIVTKAVHAATTVFNLPGYSDRALDRYFNVRVTEEVIAGRLTRNPEAPGGGGRGNGGRGKGGGGRGNGGRG